MAAQNIYRYSAEMTFVNGDKAKDLDPKQIKSIVIDYEYDNYNMPLIFITMAISKNILDDMIKNADTGLINFTLYKYVSNSDVANIKTIRIKDQFVYFVSDDLNPNKNLDDADVNKKEQEDLRKVTTIGLIKLNHLKWNKKVINGVLNNTTMVNAISYCAGHTSLLLEPLKYNKTLSQLIIPPVNSVSAGLKYLNNISVFYDTPYRFFMDFDVTYLLSSAGKPVIKKGEKKACHSVVFRVRSITDKMAVDQGMYIDNTQKIYQIDVSAVDTYRNKNKYIEKSYNNITAVTNNGKAGSSDLMVNNSKYMNTKRKAIRLPNGNTNMLSNIQAQIQNSAVTIDINKNDLDSSIFTLNKEYMINCQDVYPGDEGKYLLSSKKELYIRENEDFVSNVMLSFRKIAK